MGDYSAVYELLSEDFLDKILNFEASPVTG